MSKQSFNVMFGIVVAIFIGAWFYSGNIKPQYASQDEADPQAIVDRIRPLGQAVVTGQEPAAMPAPAAQTAGAAQAAATEVIDTVRAAAESTVAQGAEVIEKVQESAETVAAKGAEVIDKARSSAGAVVAQAVAVAAPAAKLGQETYAMACFACHTTGVAGSPKIGDAEAWAPRIAQGTAVLNKHAIEGFQGSTGMMPAKGGRVDLSDEAIAAAVTYMVNESGGQ